jgi:hypothetical protein
VERGIGTEIACLFSLITFLLYSICGYLFLFLTFVLKVYSIIYLRASLLPTYRFECRFECRERKEISSLLWEKKNWLTIFHFAWLITFVWFITFCWRGLLGSGFF